MDRILYRDGISITCRLAIRINRQGTGWRSRAEHQVQASQQRSHRDLNVKRNGGLRQLFATFAADFLLSKQTEVIRVIRASQRLGQLDYQY